MSRPLFTKYEGGFYKHGYPAKPYEPATDAEILAQPCVVEALRKKDEEIALLKQALRNADAAWEEERGQRLFRYD